MRTIIPALLLLMLTTFCSETKVEPRQSTYYIHQANFNPVRGQATFTDLGAGKMEVSISLVNTSPYSDFPAHIHFGSVNEVGELAFALNPVDGVSGKSVTILDQVELSNGDILTYDRLKEINGSIKIHMNSNLFKHMVLAFGNIGKNEDYFFDGVAVCVGH